LMLLGEKGEGDGTVWDGIVGLLNVATFRSVSNLRSVQV
jgi:hypothetical protein